jgi:protocatechuate 3,4-dioxygenase beta subunit
MATISRRHFLGAGAGSLVIAACARRPASAAPTPRVVDHDDPTCGDPTAPNIEGPFYKRGAPHRAVLVGAHDPGERFAVSGVVRSTSCAPLAGAEMEIWQADASGAYDNDGYRFRGALTTDAKGRWELHTIVPGRYLNGDRYRPSHIHIKLRAAGHRALTTQLYFTGDPYNDGDPFIVASLIMKQRAGRATFDFVLPPV